MKQTYRYGLMIIVVIVGIALLEHYRTVRTEARFLRDYKTVAALAENMGTNAPQGFQSSFPHLDTGHVDLAAREGSVRDSLHFGHSWEGNSFRQAIYRPATAEAGETNPPLDAAEILKHYFGGLERNGFTSGERGYGTTATTDSTEVARKYWCNWDRTLIVQGQIVKNRASGEIIASVSYWGTLNYHPR